MKVFGYVLLGVIMCIFMLATMVLTLSVMFDFIKWVM